MRNASLLDTSELRRIDDLLDAGELEQAQKLLADVDVGANEEASTYLATRLLYLRDRLDPDRVVLRLKELLGKSPEFQEALSLLRVAETGIPGPESLSAMPAVRAVSPGPERPRDRVADMGQHPTEPALQIETTPGPAPSYSSERPSPQPGPQLAPNNDAPSATASEPRQRKPPPVLKRQIEVDTRASTVPSAPPMVPTAALLSPSSRPSGRYAFADPAARSAPPPRNSVPAAAKSRSPSDRVPLRDLRQPRIPLAPGLPNLHGATTPQQARSAQQVRPPSAPSSPPTATRGGEKQSLPPPRPSEAPSRNERGSRPPPSIPAPSRARGTSVGRYSLTSSRPRANTTTQEFRVPRPGSLAPSSRPVPMPEESRQIWPDIEVALFAGQTEPVWVYLERSAREAIAELGAERDSFEALANAASRLLTCCWVSHHFAPFDLSLHSLARLELLMATLLGSGRPGRVRAETPSLNAMLGAYLGETLCISHQGKWKGHPSQPDTVTVSAGDHAWQPFELIRRIWLAGGRPRLRSGLRPGLARPGTKAWLHHRVNPAPLPKLWDDLPGPEHMPVLGAGLCHSVLGLSCQLMTQVTLDRSLGSLVIVNQVVEILTRSATPLSGTEAWLQRLSVLVGAYVGEVLRMKGGGVWQSTPEAPLLERHFLRLPNGRRATPAAELATRALTGKGPQLQGYVRDLLGPPQ